MNTNQKISNSKLNLNAPAFLPRNFKPNNSDNKEESVITSIRGNNVKNLFRINNTMNMNNTVNNNINVQNSNFNFNFNFNLFSSEMNKSNLISNSEIKKKQEEEKTNSKSTEISSSEIIFNL
jgi:hypothetical protein